MANFAKIENGFVTDIIAADQDFIDGGFVTGVWLETDYYTKGNIHLNTEGMPDQGTAFRGNYASIGYVYDFIHDVFYEPQPFPSWTLDSTSWTWKPPVNPPKPNGRDFYQWDEATTSWIEA